MNVTGGATDVTTYFVLRLSATGAEATGLTIANIDLQYTRSGLAPSAKVDATALAATNTAHTDNYAIEIDATDQPGLYRVDWPDAAFEAGVKEVILSVKCATCFTEHLRVSIDSPVNVTTIDNTVDAGDLGALVNDYTADSGFNVSSMSANTLTASALASDAVTELVTAILAGTVDGIALSSLLEAVLAVTSGVATVSGSDISFKKRNGTTSKITITVGGSDGARTASTIDS